MVVVLKNVTFMKKNTHCNKREGKKKKKSWINKMHEEFQKYLSKKYKKKKE